MRVSQANLATTMAVSLVLFISVIILYSGISVIHVSADRLVETGGELKWPLETAEEPLGVCNDNIATKAASTPHKQEKEVKEHRLRDDVEIKENLTAMFGSIGERYVSAIVTDKPVYRPGDSLYARGTTFGLEGGKKFEQHAFHGNYFHFVLKGPRGDTIVSQFLSDLWFFNRIPEDIVGGYYTLECWGSSYKIAPSHRTFQVQAYHAPRLLIKLETTRDLYSYGERITAPLSVEQLYGGVPKRATVTTVMRIDGNEVYRSDALALPILTGKMELIVGLPASWDCGVGILTATVVTPGGVSESKTITLPLAVPKLQVVSLPGGEPLATITTSHEGRGRSSHFTPPVSTTGLEFRVTHPLLMNVSLAPELFSVSGATLRALKDSYGPESSVQLGVACTMGVSQPLRLALYKKELELVSTSVNPLEINEMVSVELTPPSTTLGWGVLRATLYDADGVPIAERLIYREPDCDDPPVEGYTAAPASTVRFKASVTDQNGIPAVNATIGVTISDVRPWTVVQERHLPPRLLQALIIEPEVEEVMDPNAFPLYHLDEHESQRFDLLLGTQGWRRFVYKDPINFLDNGTGEKLLRYSLLGLGTKQQHGVHAHREGMVLMAVATNAVEGDMMMDDRAAAAMNEADNEKTEDIDSIKDVVMPTIDLRPLDIHDGEVGAPQIISDDIEEEESKLGRYVGSPRERTRPNWKDSNRHRFSRVYAHRKRQRQHYSEEDKNKNNILTRSDFTETVFFAMELHTDSNGTATSDFDLSDSITKYLVHADVISQEGVIGAASLNNLTVSLPVSVGATLPPFLTEGDFIQAPISSTILLNRNLRGKQSKVALKAHVGSPLRYLATSQETGEELWTHEENSTRNDSGTTTTTSVITTSIMQSVESLRVSLPIEVGRWFGEHVQGIANLTCHLEVGTWRDSLSLSTVILPKGFPVRSTGAGTLSRASTVGKMSVILPEDLIDGSVRVSFSVYPSTLASLTKSLEAIIMEPFGCFEQVSATTYPMVLALEYFSQQSSTSVPDGLVTKATRHLEGGLKKLLSYESEQGGFEWFGRSPAHEALSAYAVLQFTDMRAVFGAPPQDVVDRTTKWVLSRADGDGGFLLNPKSLDSFGYAPKTVSNLFILYALLSANVPVDEPAIKAGISALKNNMPLSDTYELALAGLVLTMAGDEDESMKVAQILSDAQEDDGRVPDAHRSITNSVGECLHVETTALSTLAWMSLSTTHDGSWVYALSVEKGVRWLMERCKDGMYGSTQGTILTLKAILQYNRLKAQSIPGSKFSLVLMDEREDLASSTIHFLGDDSAAATHGLQPLRFDSKDIEVALQASKEYLLVLTQEVLTKTNNADNNVADDRISDWTLPWSGSVSWRSTQPPSSRTSPLILKTSISNNTVREGESVEICAVVTLSANGPSPYGMIVARVGIPAGLEPRMDRLRELQKEGTIDSFELLNSDIIFYWDGILPGKKVITCFDTGAIVPGSYTGKASRAWLYYADSDSEYWERPIRVMVVPFSASL